MGRGDFRLVRAVSNGLVFGRETVVCANADARGSGDGHGNAVVSEDERGFHESALRYRDPERRSSQYCCGVKCSFSTTLVTSMNDVLGIIMRQYTV